MEDENYSPNDDIILQLIEQEENQLRALNN